ncbi:Smr domain protein [Aspergillus luchuensis]|uniref:Smr domain protein n=1 Tax=Aspergillus kawachii TaxID=1069201 RepID=A0A146FPG0_ASPKA|nr:Smr domain protein [Aspergillus luchuensis]
MGEGNGGGRGGKSRVGEGDVVVAVVGDGGGFDRLPDVWPLSGLGLLKATTAPVGAGAGAASATARWGPGILRQGSSGGAENAWLE